MKKKIEGSGLTKVWATTISLEDFKAHPEEIAKMFADASSGSTESQLVDAFLSEMRDFLKVNGLPNDDSLFIITDNDGNWRHSTCDLDFQSMAGQGEFTRPSFYIQKRNERFTKERFAAEAIRADWRLGLASTRDEIAEAAMHLGATMVRYAWKFKHELAALEGYRGRSGRKLGQPAAVEARREQGRKSYRIVVREARRISAENAEDRMNDSKLARKIQSAKIPELIGTQGRTMSISAIRKHIAQARAQGKLPAR